MELKKSTFVRHPKEGIFQKWGVGIVLEDERFGHLGSCGKNMESKTSFPSYMN
ncbi:MAG: hypothetical protein QGM50_11720 [Anaerolineae bacterium]|nr:hypothetical protein [Anaerolineae bacterium]